MHSKPSKLALMESLVARAVDGNADPDQIAQAISELFIAPVLAELERASDLLKHAGYKDARLRAHRSLEPWGIR